jgi:hypothetical protein
MTVNFLKEAEDEFIAAIQWYESRERGLGKRFRNEVGRVIERIAEDPLLWRERPGAIAESTAPSFPTTLHTSFADRQLLWLQ